MQKYTPGVLEDLALLNWWLKLSDTGDLARAFNREAASLNLFMRIFDPPTELWYEAEIGRAHV